jgi:hypothetical protein
MVTKSQRQEIESAYRTSIDPRTALAKCAAGLLIIVGVAGIGVATGESYQSNTTALNASRVATGR